MGSVLLLLPPPASLIQHRRPARPSFPGRSQDRMVRQVGCRRPGVPLVAFDHGKVGARLVGDWLGSLVGDLMLLDDRSGNELESRGSRSRRMAGAISHHALASTQSCGWSAQNSRFEKRTGNVRLVYEGSCRSGSRKLGLVCASGSQSSVVEPVKLPSDGNSSHTPKKSSESALILIRHGESLWNEKNLFTGCVDIPIIMHNENEQAHKWSQIYSEETKKQSIPVITAWQLNERMYGELQGLNKQETADRFGQEQVHEWRHSYDIPPPNGESLEMCAERAVAYFKEQIVPQLVAGKHVMVAAHGNSLRSIIMHLDKLTSQEVISLELSTGIPMLYIFKEGKFIRRGSPVGPSEASVYAYTRTLAKYRQKLDNMVQ
ncbi:2,3-bisphosphoglycerate-dependent phosphoglycerate mutase-like [Panicum miliaceum]|uniref:phosphoglycerate mutase (2,3-diphosphoglycerate-dependent) n=1 Tax=Panicum miliaceum TaxID=4540 RepID=A0A3L6PEC2_PANMI|nr:2,3-bisphosphoglycerate-dependent phosphoglycerate mutase-like [Panicum miliaceum]